MLGALAADVVLLIVLRDSMCSPGLGEGTGLGTGGLSLVPGVGL